MNVAAYALLAVVPDKTLISAVTTLCPILSCLKVKPINNQGLRPTSQKSVLYGSCLRNSARNT